MLYFFTFAISVSFRFFSDIFWDFMIFVVPAILLYSVCSEYLKIENKKLKDWLFAFIDVAVFLWLMFFMLATSFGSGTIVAEYTNPYVHRVSVSFDFLYWFFAWCLVAMLSLIFSSFVLDFLCNKVESFPWGKLQKCFFLVSLSLLALSFPVLTSYSLCMQANKGYKMAAGVEDINDWLDLGLSSVARWDRPSYLKIDEDALTRSFVEALNEEMSARIQNSELGAAVGALFLVEDVILNEKSDNAFKGKNLIVEYYTKPNSYFTEEELVAFNRKSIQIQEQSLRNCYFSEDPRAMLDVFAREFFDEIVFKDFRGDVIKTINLKNI